MLERQSADQIETAKQQLQSSSRNSYGDAMLKFYEDPIKFTASNNFETGQDGEVKHCQGQLTLTRSNGVHLDVNILYDVISTEDGNLLVNEQNVAHESPAEAGAQLLMSLSNPKTPNPSE